MARTFGTIRLADPDPWTVVAEARAHRGPIVAAWCRTALARLWFGRSQDAAPVRSAFAARPDTTG